MSDDQTASAGEQATEEKPAATGDEKGTEQKTDNNLEDLSPTELAELLRTTRREAAKYRTRAKELEPFEAQAREAQEAQKTELQKVMEQLEQFKTQASESTLEAARLRVAFEKGLTPAQARRLVGSTEDELMADADELVETFKTPNPTPAGRPRESLRGGREPDQEAVELDPAKLAAMVRRDSFI